MSDLGNYHTYIPFMYVDLGQILTHVLESLINKGSGTARVSVPALTKAEASAWSLPARIQAHVPSLPWPRFRPLPHICLNPTEESCLTSALTKLKFRRSTCLDPLRPRSCYCTNPRLRSRPSACPDSNPCPVPALTQLSGPTVSLPWSPAQARPRPCHD